jgi:hypothetical protein
MMYEKQFVIAVLHDGSPVREIDGKVTLPFGSEYKVRLKNKNNVRAKARVWIDGRKASNLGDFILNPGETLDLERFLDESMSEGRRFKFVRASDRRVNDPTDPDNGTIKVEFYKEQTFKIDWNPPVRPIKPLPKGNGPDWWYTTNTNTTGGNPRRGMATTTCYASNSISSSTLCSSEQAGATVEGGHSSQNFVIGDDFDTEVFPITLTLKVQGPRKGAEISPPRRPQPRVKYCGSCGKRRMRRDRFCPHCGTKFPSKRRRE